MRSTFLRASTITVAAMASLLFGSAVQAGVVSYTPLAFGPLTDPGNGAYYTNVYDISADGQSYTGILSQGGARFVSNGTNFRLNGTGGPFGISADGQTVVGGLAGQVPQRWDLASAVGDAINSQAIPLPGGAFVSNPAYGTNANGTAFSISSPTGVLTDSAFKSATPAFTAIDPAGFAGANRGIAAYAPVAAVLGHLPSNSTNGYRWNYETGAVTPLNLPAGASNMSIGGVGTSLSGDASIIGGSAATPESSGINAPYYWDADGTPHKAATVGSRVWGSMNAVNYTGTLGGGNLFGAGLPNHAFLFDFANDVSFDLNDLFAAHIPEGWILTHTTHISNDGSRIFAQALAPDGTTRSVFLEGEYVPAPGSAGLLALFGVGAARRRRR